MRADRTLSIAWLMAASVVFRGNSINYAIGPAAIEFGLGGEGTQAFKLVPNIGQLLVVFLAGLLAERFGARRTLTWGSLGLLAGGLACTVAPNPTVMNVGLLVAAAGTSTTIVAVFALIGSAVSGTAERAKAFGVVATAMPIVSLVSPFICGWLSTNTSWRWITAIWVAFGALTMVLALIALPKDTPSANRDEYLTPLLAGIALVAIVQAINEASAEAPGVIVAAYLGGAAASLIGIVVARKQMSRTSLSLEPVRNKLPVLMLLAIALGTLTYQWYIGFLAFENLYGLTGTEVAVVMIPTQVLCIMAARVAPLAIVHSGLRITAVAGSIAIAVSCLLFLAIQPGQSPWVLAGVMAIYGFIATGTSVAVSNAAMNALPKEHSGAMSSFRAASSALGSGVATVVMGVLVLGVYDVSVAQQIDSGAQVSPATSATTRPLSDVAMTDALHAKSIASAVFAVASAGVLAFAIRRREAEPEESAAEERSASS